MTAETTNHLTNEATKEDKKASILEAFGFRHACKAFDSSKKIPQEDFGFILETARLSPSSYGFEPWRFLVLQNEALRRKLLPVVWGGQGQLPTASHLVVALARKKQAMLPDSPHVQRIMREVHHLPDAIADMLEQKYEQFLNEGFKLIENDRAMFEWACRQTYLAVGNMMTAAAQIGIDSCPMEGFDKDGVEQALREEGLLDGEEFGVACFVAFGYRKEQPARPKSRQAMEEIVQWVE
ncbi:NAD(P)H-dependent oxidoreductase [Paenibacillus sp. HB172176]|uniref:NAD(P)H-dependent oxidoreductase n=1 Tax=Paenibacillus sp. HB172176 TaxID=2493690 RepID=UPI00143C5C6D|nr:NAD(P)H-dependent oxidoreductase [Paenibacillus sp. HB172176]